MVAARSFYTLLAFSALSHGSAVLSGLVVPLYAWPTDSSWARVEQAAKHVKDVQVVINPNNGHIAGWSESKCAIWKQLSMKLKQSGVRVLAYVSTCNLEKGVAQCSSSKQGRRPLANVQGDAEAYAKYIGIDGIFFDDAPGDSNVESNMRLYSNFAHSNGLDVIFNPGAVTTDAKILDMCDHTVWREDTTPDCKAPSSKYPESPPTKFDMILNSVSSSHWKSYADRAAKSGFGRFYATGGSYTKLPNYFEEMVQYIASQSTARTELV